MIGRVNVKVSSGHVNMPLQPVAVFKDGAASVFVENVPFSRDGLTITGVRVSVMNAVGETRVYEAKRQSSAWTVTVPETHFAAAGVVRNGFTVYAVGTDENGVARAWPMGRGDLYVIACDSNAVNLGEYVNLRLMDAKLDQPHKGDLVKVSGGYQLYNGTSWEALGGGGGGVPILTLATLAQNGIKKDGETVLFAELRELHLAGAVLQYDGANYFPHYHSGTELMWDCTGTMAGKVQTRRVHAVKSGETDNYTVSASARTPLAPEDHHHTSGQIDDLGAAVVNIGAEQFAAKSHTHTDSEIIGLDVAIGSVGSGYFAGKSHTHVAREITDMASATRYELTETYKDGGTITLGANKTTYIALGGAAFTGNITIEASRSNIAGRVTDFVLYILAEQDTTITYDTWGGSVGWFAPDKEYVKTIKANVLTMFYFTEAKPPDQAGQGSYTSAIYAIGKTELQEVV